jgi:hypothetical protein
MEFVLPLSLIVLLGIVLGVWLKHRRAYEFANQLKQDAKFDRVFRPVTPGSPARARATQPPQAKAAPTTTSPSAKVQPVTTPLRELAVVLYELHGYQRTHARANQAPVHFWLHAPGQSQPAYALMEVECEQPLEAAHLAALIKRLPPTPARNVVLCKEGFTREARAMAKQQGIDLANNKTLKRKLSELPEPKQAALREQVRRNLAATAH